MELRGISNFGEDGYPSLLQPLLVVLAGETEYYPTSIAIESRNKMLHDQHYCSTVPGRGTLPRSCRHKTDELISLNHFLRYLFHHKT
jgi:hypothetical protein